MTHDIGPQYHHDDAFKAAARLHQSTYRAAVLQVGYARYGNRLNDADGAALLNYYDSLGVRQMLRQRYPGGYARRRDADLLRSEHIPFNLFAPLADRADLLKTVLIEAFELELNGPFAMNFEWAPRPPAHYLGDLTSFDVYLQGAGANGERVGVGIEVKYTEQGYRIGASEAKRVNDPNSTYWNTTRNCGLFVGGGSTPLAADHLRQIWRNHLLGLAMVQRGDIERFVSVTLYPADNQHFTAALAAYQDKLVTTAQRAVRGCTYERFIGVLRGNSEIEAWRQYLTQRYLVRVGP